MASFYPSHPEMDCVSTNAAGVSYEDLTCLYPKIGKTYVPLELACDPVSIRDYMRENPWIPLLAVAAYGLWIVFGRAYFSGRKPLNMRTAMAYWNLALAVFSGIGFLRTFPQLVHNLMSYSMRDNLCFDPEANYGSGPTGLWVQLFCLSKIPELVDTFFIVIHKKKLIFLHWYHHVTVLLYCWHSYVTSAPSGLFFVVMNYAVHSIMYFYYFLMAVKLKPKWMNAMIITVAQISQMVVGVAVTTMSFRLVGTENCWARMENTAAAFAMYGSYLLLFLKFFVGRYFSNSKGSGNKGKVKKQ